MGTFSQKRRDFIKLSAASTGGLLTFGSQFLFPQSKSNDHNIYRNNDWTLKKYFEELLNNNEYQFPYPDIFEHAGRIMPLKYKGKYYYACLSLATKKKTSLEIYIGDRLDNLLNKNPYKLEVEGDVNCPFPIENIESDRIFYQVFYDGKPLSPPRSFKHPKYSKKIVAYFTADNHMFDDHFIKAVPINNNSSIVSGLEAEYFYHYLNKSLKNPFWFKQEKDSNLKPNTLRNTFHLANTVAHIIRNGQQPDFIIKLGDDTGIQQYRYSRQGLLLDDYENNAEKLWKREIKVWSVLSSLIPVYQVIGNHDGELAYGQEGRKTRPHAVRFRKRFFKQPGFLEGGSPDENYYVIPWGNNGNRDSMVEFIVLDIAGYMNKNPRNPKDWTIGETQMEWYKKILERSRAPIKFVLFHHVVGGLPRNSSGDTEGAYGRGPLLTRKDYEGIGIDPDKIEQVKITELAKKNGVSGFLYGHDHIHFLRKGIDINSRNIPMFCMCVGSTNEVLEEGAKWYGKFADVYGYPEDLEFLSPPVIESLTIEGFKGYLDTICTSDPDRLSNLNHFDHPMGKTLRKDVLIL